MSNGQSRPALPGSSRDRGGAGFGGHIGEIFGKGSARLHPTI